ncbi:hypothetical protein V1514DRAFT_105947 [Lipomyces japonicus]|uniref:uncharacterized protein n=1 Tax=Lipomyces japonicus TaxID=56871 RepID=UPI0034CD43FD
MTVYLLTMVSYWKKKKICPTLRVLNCVRSTFFFLPVFRCHVARYTLLLNATCSTTLLPGSLFALFYFRQVRRLHALRDRVEPFLAKRKQAQGSGFGFGLGLVNALVTLTLSTNNFLSSTQYTLYNFYVQNCTAYSCNIFVLTLTTNIIGTIGSCSLCRHVIFVYIALLFIFTSITRSV